MTKRIPQVGDKYKCMDGRCRVAKTGGIVTITDVFNEDYFSVKYITSDHKKGCWEYIDYPEDFEYVPETQQFERPPLGLTPIHIADGASVADILEAMLKCVKAGKAVDREWLAELIEKIEVE